MHLVREANVHQALSFLVFLLKRFESNENRKAAAALTFVSLFAVVPLMTFAYSLLTYFPEYAVVVETFQNYLFQHFVPTSGQELHSYLNEFAQQARKLTVLGLTVLLFSAVALMLTLESAFNRIWRIKSIRVGRSLVLYWLILIVGPLLLGAGFLVTSYLFSSQLWQFYFADAPEVNHGVVRALPFLLSILAFSLTYYFLPRSSVRLKHALIGGVLGTLLLEIAKSAFVKIAAWSGSYQVVYGAFALVPLSLLWIYVAWSVVLLGAELVRALPFVNKELKGIKASELDWALMVLQNINCKGGQLSKESLIIKLGLANADEWERVINSLISHAWIESHHEAWYLVVNLDEKTVGELSEVIHGRLIDKFVLQLQGTPWLPVLDPILKDLREQKKAALGLPISRLI